MEWGDEEPNEGRLLARPSPRLPSSISGSLEEVGG